jgi:hypothetical protein
MRLKARFAEASAPLCPRKLAGISTQHLEFSESLLAAYFMDAHRRLRAKPGLRKPSSVGSTAQGCLKSARQGWYQPETSECQGMPHILIARRAPCANILGKYPRAI